jgi:hypothetical protein
MRRTTPIGAFARGLIAGAIGAGVQTLFSRITQPLAPQPPRDAFTPPEPQQRGEGETETVARRPVEGLAPRGPLDGQTRRRAGQLVRFGFGAAWGGLYNLLRASYPRLGSAPGIAGFALSAWAVSDNLILPLFEVAGAPQRDPLRTHAYAIAAHLAYGAGVAGALAALERPDVALASAVLLATRGRALGRHVTDRSEALVPRDLVEQSRHFAAALARRARDLRSS